MQVTSRRVKKVNKMEYEFILKFELPDADIEAEQYLEALFEAGCDDATIGIGKKGAIALDFTREGKSADDAVLSAIENVKKAIPNAKLIEVSPDLVTPTEIASVVGFTRQNVQKIISSPKKRFPSPIHQSSAGGIWHLEPVLRWFMEDGHKIDKQLLEVANISMATNITNQTQKIDPSIQQRLLSLI